LILILTLVDLSPTPPLPDHYCLYASVYDQNRIAYYKFDPNTGLLVATGNVFVQGSPFSLAVHPTRQFVYVSLNSSSNSSLGSFLVEERNGSLDLMNSVQIPQDQLYYLTTDKSGGWLVVTFYTLNKIGLYPIQNDGKLCSEGILIDTCVKPHMVLFDPSNHYAYVPCVGTDQIMQYTFDQIAGKLSPNIPAFVFIYPGAEPRNIIYHPLRKWLYLLSQWGTVTGLFQYDNGTLRTFQTVSAVPPGDNGTKYSAEIRITRDGGLIYASNRGSTPTMTGFLLNVATGLLTSTGQFLPIPTVPEDFELDPLGRYLYSSDMLTGNINSYAINLESGLITPMKVVSIGGHVVRIYIVKMPY